MSKTICSSDNKHNLHHTLYEPKDGAPTATLLIVHGMMEHSGRYSDFAQYLADNGIAVLAYDQLGHGGSIQTADDLGFFNKQHPVQTLLKDVVLMANKLKARHPAVPHFIMGHSMGSFIVRNVLQHHSHDFTGAILMGTSDYDPLITPLLPIVTLLNKVKPKQKNAVFSNVTNKILKSKLKDNSNPSKYAWLTKNEDSLREYENDPLTGFDFTNNGFYGLLNIMHTGLDKNWAQTIDNNFPMLLVSGEDDPVGNMGKGIRKLDKRMHGQGFSQVQTKLYSGMRHEPLHEKGKQEVYDDILHWIEKYSKA